MADPLSLYTSVMGRLWEDERIRGKTQARIDARLAGRRQGRSYARVGRLSVRNIAKAASGQSRAAVFKRIRAGGCKTRGSLGNQLSYINDKAVFTYSTMTNPLDEAAVLTGEQKDEIIEAWAETWRGTTKLGFTSHMFSRSRVMSAQTRSATSPSTGRSISSKAASMVISGTTCWRFMTTGRIVMRTSF